MEQTKKLHPSFLILLGAALMFVNVQTIVNM